MNPIATASASLWGCELKYKALVMVKTNWKVSLLVMLWVEMCLMHIQHNTMHRQPPCEAVSWNVHSPISLAFPARQPPCEAVSWNKEHAGYPKFKSSQPPCEAVSWNVDCITKNLLLPGQPPCEAVSWNAFYHPDCNSQLPVSLLVRLWVEMRNHRNSHSVRQSASLWGCELKYWKVKIVLRRIQSASLWGCELKWYDRKPNFIDNLSASLWGCELKLRIVFYTLHMLSGQPPCEAVSWNKPLCRF